MLRSPRSVIRAASLIVALFVLVGCAPLSPLLARATRTPVAPPATTVAAPRPTEPTALRLPAQPAPAATPVALPPNSSQPVKPIPQPIAPAFGPAWGDRAVYEAGLIATERQALDAFAGASEYRIDLRIDDSLTRVTGAQQVHYTNQEAAPLDEIWLRLFPNALGGTMRVREITVDGAGVAPEYQYDRTAIRVPLPEPLAPGENVVLGLQYEIEIPDTLDTGYGLLSFTNNILALDAPYAPIPVYNADGWNVETPPENADTSFNDAGFYLVRVTAPAELKLVVTGVEVARAEAGGAQIVTVAQGPARDFFVAASKDYVVSSQQHGETRVNSYALPGEDAAQAVALDAAIKALDVYGQRFGPYPYTELDVAATPMLALGIEYPGAVGISERVYDPHYESQSGPAAAVLESTVAHELAHQWFYNLVGSDQQDEPWLDEALAQYSTWLYFVDIYGQDAGEDYRASWDSRWERTDCTDCTVKPVDLPADAYTDREYSSIVYGRGPLFLTALAERMGQPGFDAFLKDYSARFRWGIATAEEFKALAEEACGCDLADLFAEWLDPQ